MKCPLCNSKEIETPVRYRWENGDIQGVGVIHNAAECKNCSKIMPTEEAEEEEECRGRPPFM